jgi:tRNA (guanine26-N2/guanine27-N2)-dimethyltransferase
MKLAKDGSLIMITTTDTAVLCGAHEPACYKIYNSKPLHNELCKEVGTRILINYIAKTAAQFNFGINVLLSISSQHYMRIFIDMRFGSKLAVASVKNTGFGGYCPSCHAFSMKAGLVPRLIPKCEYCKHELELFGPLWLGNLYDKATAAKMLNKEDKMSKDAIKIMEIITTELDTPLFYSIPKLTKSLGIGSVSHYEVIKRLKENGFEATTTQFDPDGVKTNAKSPDVIKAVKAKA